MKYALLALAFLLPGGAIFADEIGFAQSPVWVSHTPITEGQTVLLHAALSNNSDKVLTGTVVFKDSDTKIGAIPFSLEVGEGRVVSLSWKATAGSHSITAQITGASDSAAADTQTLDVAVAAKPVPAATSPQKKVATSSAAAVDFSNANDIESAITSISPKAGEISGPAFLTIDSLRKKSADVLGAQAVSQQARVASLSAKKADLAKQNTPEAQSESRTTTAYQVGATILLYVYEILLVVVSKAAIFYPIFAFFVLWLLYKGYQRVRRPTGDY